MWQRFTERARKVVFFAQEEAQKFGEGYVSTEHILLGLVTEDDSTAARVLERLGVKRGRIRTEIEKQLPDGDSILPQDMSLTPRAKRVIDLAYDEARKLKNNYIGTEHLLLGLIREGDGLASLVLNKLGVELERARDAVRELQDDGAPTRDEGDESDVYGSTMLAQQKLANAEKEAEMFGLHGLVYPIHLLWALVSSPACAACSVLTDLGVKPADLLVKVVKQLSRREATSMGATRSEALEEVLESASGFAAQLDCHAIATEHFLIALVGCGDKKVEQLLVDEHGLTVDSVIEAVKSFYASDASG
ncbi:MAG: hypothetical protein IH944_05685 [Armatimonadetes bacterium]|nr:hypothetical protein [Armatimonadota bacterium]